MRETDFTQNSYKKATNSKVILYRGKDQFVGNRFEQKIRTDRKPLHSDPFSVSLFDCLMKSMNWKFRKSNTLSVSVDEEQAYEFGSSVYRIYPDDTSVYLYSSNYDDFISIPKLIINAYVIQVTKAPERGLGAPSFVGSKALEVFNSMKVSYEKDPNGKLPIYDFITKQNYKLADKAGLHITKNIDDLKKAVGEVLVLGASYIGEIT